MIPERWYAVAEARRVRRAGSRGGRPLGVRRLGRDWVLWRSRDGDVVCMADRCPHRGVALSRGRLRGGELECGYHGFRFDASGACTHMPCEGRDAKIPRAMRAHTLPVREAYGLVWLYLPAEGAGPAEPNGGGTARDAAAATPVAWFEEMGDVRPGDVSGTLDWPQHYARTIESNFDVHHTPFLHRGLVPGAGTRVDPYEVEVEGDSIRTRGELRHEHRGRGLAFRVDFKAPATTLLELGGVRFVVADCPVDDEHTWRYVRYRWTGPGARVPGLRTFLAWSFYQVDFRLAQLRQDRPMVRTQRPRRPDEGRDRLVRADAGTAAYLKLRRRLRDEARDALRRAS